MRSYYAHLETPMPPVATAVLPRPVFRSSAIFPVFQQPGISVRIVFLGYWILKRNIQQIAAVVTLRNQEGKTVARSSFSITESKAYRIELQEMLEKAGFSKENPFIGSIEVEFFSTVNLVFPYPAVVINFYGPQFSSVVHTAQRTYNDFDDMRNNSQTQVPESGFNVYADEDHEPFFAMINGGTEVPNAIARLQVYNQKQEVLEHQFSLGTLKPYQTAVVYPAPEMDLKSFLGGKVGAAKVYFQLNWVFPRLLVGNMTHHLPAMTITHTYYDCSQASSESDYWKPAEKEWFPASLMIPVTIQGNHFTNVYFYPIYSPSTFMVDVEIYDPNGKLLGKKENILTITSPNDVVLRIEMKALCQELGIPAQSALGARIIARAPEGKRIPARIKIGLDLGNSQIELPCNICTNLQPFNPSVEGKPKSFRWAPILADQPLCAIWIINSSPRIDYHQSAEIDLTFFRESDAATLTRKVTLAPHGLKVIQVPHDEELAKFFGGGIGWFTATTTNPYTTTFYFADHPSGIVGGDHGF